MLLIIGTIRLPPASLATARPAMERMIHASRSEDGCLAYSYAQDLLEPGLIRITELWRDRDCLDRHFSSAHIGEWRAQWASLAISDRHLVVHEVSASRAT